MRYSTWLDLQWLPRWQRRATIDFVTACASDDRVAFAFTFGGILFQRDEPPRASPGLDLVAVREFGTVLTAEDMVGAMSYSPSGLESDDTFGFIRLRVRSGHGELRLSVTSAIDASSALALPHVLLYDRSGAYHTALAFLRERDDVESRNAPTIGGGVGPHHLVASAFIFNDRGQVLFVRENYGARRYGPPGGSVEPGESPHAAAAREAWEEAGLVVLPTHLIALRYANGARGTWLGFNFRCQWVSGQPRLPPTGEISEVLWADPLEPPRPLNEAATHVLEAALADNKGHIIDLSD